MLTALIGALRVAAYIVFTMTIATFLQGKPVPVWGAWITAIFTAYTISSISYLYYVAKIAVSSVQPEDNK